MGFMRWSTDGACEFERLSVRQELSVPMPEELEAHRDSSEKCWTRAGDYTLGRWPSLRRYTGAGRVDIDNNAVERAIRPLTLGRKNYLFAGSHAGAHQSALFYSLLGTCVQLKINPEDWLTDPKFDNVPALPISDSRFWPGGGPKSAKLSAFPHFRSILGTSTPQKCPNGLLCHQISQASGNARFFV